MLFNKDGQGSIELYRLTGTFKASTDFATIKNDIEDATAELRTAIGDVVKKAEDEYSNGGSSDLLQLVQRAVACRALCYFAKNTGLSHDNTGRKLKVDENEKIPFEWMIDRDDRELRERYYRALDRLYLHLEESNIEEWKKSSIYKQREKLFVKEFNAFEDVYPLNGSRYTFYKLIPLLHEAQKRLQVVLKLGDKPLPQIPETTKYIVLSTLAQALERWSLNIFPLEISRGFSPSYQGNQETQVATFAEIDRVVKEFRQQANEAFRDIYIEANKTNPAADIDILPNNHKGNKFFTV